MATIGLAQSLEIPWKRLLFWIIIDLSLKVELKIKYGKYRKEGFIMSFSKKKVLLKLHEKWKIVHTKT